MSTKHSLSLLIMFVTFALSMGLFGTAFAQQGVTVHAIPIEINSLLDFSMSPDGNNLAIYANPIVPLGLDFSLIPFTWVELGGDAPVLHQLRGHADYVGGAAFLGDGGTLVTAHGNGDFNVWNLAAGSIERRITTPIVGAQRLPLVTIPGGNGSHFASPNPHALLAQVVIWDAETGYMTRTLRPYFANFAAFAAFREEIRTGEPLSAFAVAPDGEHVAVATAIGRIWLWNINNDNALLLRNTEETQPRFDIRRIRFSSDGSRLIFSDLGADQIHIINADNGSNEQTIDSEMMLFDTLSNNRIAWLADDGENVLVAPLDQLDSPSVIPFRQLAQAPGIDTSAYPPDPRAQRTGQLFVAGGNHIVIGGFMNEDAQQNLVYVITLDE